MPNYCNNTLEVTVNQDRINQNMDIKDMAPEDIAEKLTQDIAEAHCQLEDFRTRAADAESNKFFTLFVPVPQDASVDDTVEVWGTKWDAQSLDVSHEADELHYAFDSAWTPPEEFCRRVSLQFPLLSFELVFDEVGMSFYGTYVYYNGECACEDGGDMEWVQEDDVQPEEWEEFETLGEHPARPGTAFAEWCLETGRYSVYHPTKRSRPSSPKDTPLTVH